MSLKSNIKSSQNSKRLLNGTTHVVLFMKYIEPTTNLKTFGGGLNNKKHI
jgi:hypothetical protein